MALMVPTRFRKVRDGVPARLTNEAIEQVDALTRSIDVCPERMADRPQTTATDSVGGISVLTPVCEGENAAPKLEWAEERAKP